MYKCIAENRSFPRRKFFSTLKQALQKYDVCVYVSLELQQPRIIRKIIPDRATRMNPNEVPWMSAIQSMLASFPRSLQSQSRPLGELVLPRWMNFFAQDLPSFPANKRGTPSHLCKRNKSNARGEAMNYLIRRQRRREKRNTWGREGKVVALINKKIRENHHVAAKMIDNCAS